MRSIPVYKKTAKKLSKKHIFSTILLGVVIGLVYWQLQRTIFSLHAKEFNDWIYQLGWKAPLTMMLLMTIEIIIPPLPGVWMGLANGYIFGPWLGFVYSYAASVIGSTILFFISRKFGQPFVHAMMSREWPERYVHKFHRARPAFGLLYAIPLFPVDIMTMFLGLTPIAPKKFIGLMMLGFIPNMLALNFLGTIVSGPDNTYHTIFPILVGVAIVYLFVAWIRQRVLQEPS